MTTTQLTATTALPISNITNFITITLNETNYLIWRNQVQPILLICDLFSYIEGTIPSPGKPNASTSTKLASDFLQWQRNDKFNCLLLSHRYTIIYRCIFGFRMHTILGPVHDS